jgi:hypothetical protein
MKLLSHLVAKDLRRMAWPVGLWIIVLMATTAGFGSLRLPSEFRRTMLPTGWVWGVGQLTEIATIVLGFAGAVLAGVLAQEDSPVGTTAFWLTRPIAGSRLLAAKTVGATLLLVIAPAAGMAVVWAAEGFSVWEIGAAALEFMAWQAVMILPALAIGAATANLGRFMFLALGASAVFVVSVSDYLHSWTGKIRYVQIDRTRTFIVLVVALTGAFAIMRGCYRKRHSRPMWILTATMVSMIVVGGSWSFDFTSAFPLLGENQNWGGLVNQVQAAWDKLVVRDGDAALTLTVSEAKVADELFAPTAADVQIAQMARWGYRLNRGARWGEAAALRLAGLTKDDGALAWEFDLAQYPEVVARLRQVPEVLSGSFRFVKMVRMHPRVMWELPLRAGEEVRVGSSFTRIVELAWINGQRTVLLHERDARLALDDGLRRQYYQFERRSDDAKVDCFLVVNRAHGFAQAAGLEDLGVAEMNSLMISISALRLPGNGELEQPAAWEKGATLIKVRFERDRSFSYKVPGGPIRVVEESKP